MPAIVFLFAGTKNFCPGTRMARSYTRLIHLIAGRFDRLITSDLAIVF